MLILDQKKIGLILIFSLILIIIGIDLLGDLYQGASITHMIEETIVMSCSVVAIAFLIFGIYQQKNKIQHLIEELETINTTQIQPKKYVLEGRKKLGSVIKKQFSEWSLTNSEIEVGWLLLKGLSLKEIAIVRNTQEKTVRQQASSIYKKSDTSGRHAFSAWFIEDIL